MKNKGMYVFNEEERRNFLIFCLTPGIPRDYIIHITRLRKRYTRAPAYWMKQRMDELLPEAYENAASITLEDGYAMLRQFGFPRRKFCGVPPHWVSMALIDSVEQIGWKPTMEKYHLTNGKLQRWRKSAFHPLTMQPLRAIPKWG